MTAKRKDPVMIQNHIFAQLLCAVISVSVAAIGAQTKPGCPNKCGNLTIPYPFGLQKGCYHDETFLINCTSNKPLLSNINTSLVQHISIDSGQLTALSSMVYECYNDSYQSKLISVNMDPFTFSATKNKFVAVGCDTLGLLAGSLSYNLTGCVSGCDNIRNVTNSGVCDGNGCCQSMIPERISAFDFGAISIQNYTNVSNFAPCSYAFVVEDGKYIFSSSDLVNLQNGKEFPVVLDWSIGNLTCKEAQRNRDNYGCTENTECYDLDTMPGYRCNCSSGYKGNPYLSNGCQDVNECLDPELNQCIEKNSCQDRNGSYTCTCPEGHSGDGRKDGQGCIADNPPPLNLILGISIGFLVLLLTISWMYFGLKKRRLIKLKEKYFQENGGYLFKQKIIEHDQTSSQRARIFTERDLKNATNNFHESQILGKGGQGTVYKGILPDKQVIAVKKSKIGDDSQVEGFINEVLILSQINHRNVVKLLGCCLETRVPLLVYEFVTNGTLFDHIHNNVSHGTGLLPWKTRLMIATQIAEALSYMHSAASTPIVHRDIKSANILLDENFTAKVSDFGASKLIPLDKSELTTLVQGTLGYLDPEYMHTSLLTEKSDVYSFGVVLVELLTRKKPISFTRQEEERNLAMHFVTYFYENRLLDIIDYQIVNEANIDQLKAVASIARNCLRVKGDERPTMKSVAIELRGLCSVMKHPWEENSEVSIREDASLLDISYENFKDTNTSITINDSAVKSAIFEIGNGR